MNLYELLAALASDDISSAYSGDDAIKHMKTLVELSSSVFCTSEVRKALIFVQRLTNRLSNLTADEKRWLIESSNAGEDF